MKEQIITQAVATIVLAIIGHYWGLNILIATGIGMVCGLIVRNMK